MAGRKIDLTGREHGDFIVVHEVEPITGLNGRKQAVWLCQCKTCGSQERIQGRYIRAGQHKFCDECFNARPDMIAKRQEIVERINRNLEAHGMNAITDRQFLDAYKHFKDAMSRI